jgi:rSAM/selenodomain-associated transferase 1
MEFPDARLLVFAKAPVPGRVKTRLVVRYGAPGAAKLYKSLLRWTLNNAVRADLCPIQLWCAPDARHGFFVTCRHDYGISLRVQQGADLGQRMHHALTQALQECAYAVLVGSDCASLNSAQLRFALKALAAGRDAVLGPAKDGGYVLIGLRRSCPALFRGISWSSSTVMRATRQRLRRAGLHWLELPLGWDVDHPRDVRRWRRQCRASYEASLSTSSSTPS